MSKEVVSYLVVAGKYLIKFSDDALERFGRKDGFFPRPKELNHGGIGFNDLTLPRIRDKVSLFKKRTFIPKGLFLLISSRKRFSRI